MAEELQHFRNLLAPGVRIALLADNVAPEERERALLEQLRRDLISLEITRHASGPGEYKLTLANWDPHSFRHRYNDFAVIRFGNRLRIDLRYWPDRQVDVLNPDAATDGWVPMIAGPITELQFAFGSEGSRLSVTGEDDLRPLKDHVEKRLTYKSNEAKIIEATLTARGYPLKPKIAGPLPRRLSFLTDESSQNRINEAHEKGQSYLEYIQKFVDAYDLELYLSFDGLHEEAWRTSRQIKQVLNLGPSRANNGPRDGVIVLRRGHELVEFNPTIKVADQFTSVRVRGRSRFRDDPNGIDGFVDVDDVATEVKNYQQKSDPQKPAPKLVTAPEVRKIFFGKNDSDTKEKTNLDKLRAEASAWTQMMRKARELVVVQASTVGLPQLEPGRYVQIEAVDDLFDGLYYVSSTTHSYGSDGMKTRFTAQRAGMPLPEGVAA